MPEWRATDDKANPSTAPGRLVTMFGKQSKREVHLQPGSRYKVEPLNARKKKNRGRYCRGVPKLLSQLSSQIEGDSLTS